MMADNDELVQVSEDEVSKIMCTICKWLIMINFPIYSRKSQKVWKKAHFLTLFIFSADAWKLRLIKKLKNELHSVNEDELFAVNKDEVLKIMCMSFATLTMITFSVRTWKSQKVRKKGLFWYFSFFDGCMKIEIDRYMMRIWRWICWRQRRTFFIVHLQLISITLFLEWSSHFLSTNMKISKSAKKGLFLTLFIFLMDAWKLKMMMTMMKNFIQIMKMNFVQLMMTDNDELDLHKWFRLMMVIIQK